MKIKMQNSIKTERLMLRSMSKNDEKNALDLLTNEQIAKTFMLPIFQERKDVIPLFERLRLLSLNERHFVYGIYLQDEMIGFLNDVGMTENSVELGYCLHPKYHNQGIMTEALKAVIRALFGVGFAKIKAGAFEENIASMRVMEKCGMTRTGEIEMIEYRGENKRCICYEIVNLGDKNDI